MKSWTLSAAALGAAFALAAAPAAAHILLSSPPSLLENDEAKSGPCGCYFGSPEDPGDDGTPVACPGDHTTTELTAGAPLQVTWIETVNHEGAFRIAFSPKPVDEVTKADMAGGIAYDEPDQNSESGATLEATVTVPATPCDSCTMQLRQDMGGTFYYACASVRIVSGGDPGGSGGAGQGGDGSGAGATGSGATGTSGPGATSGSGAGATSGDPVPIGEQPPSGADDGCSIATGAGRGGAGGWLALGCAALWLGLRRRRVA
jgi:hypothetical protein